MTDLGSRMTELPLDPMLSKTIPAGEVYRCSAEILIVLPMLPVHDSIFYRPKHRIASADAARQTFSSPDGDHFTLLNIYHQWREAHYSRESCHQNSIDYHSMDRVRQSHPST